jgi:glycosyltransferase involved in cell wall biosynthesis
VDRALFKWRNREEARAELGRRVGNQVLPDAAKTALYVGNLLPVKAPDLMLDAWSAFRRTRSPGGGSQPGRPAPELFFLGDGPMRKRLQRQAAGLGIAGDVRFVGNRPHEEIALWMSASDCLCLPSRSEGMPNVVVEALACGLPVVAADVGEVRFLVKDGVNGAVVDLGGDRLCARFAGAVDRVLGREWDSRSIASQMTHYTWDNATQTILRALDRSG